MEWRPYTTRQRTLSYRNEGDEGYHKSGHQCGTYREGSNRTVSTVIEGNVRVTSMSDKTVSCGKKDKLHMWRDKSTLKCPSRRSCLLHVIVLSTHLPISRLIPRCVSTGIKVVMNGMIGWRFYVFTLKNGRTVRKISFLLKVF